MANRVKILGAFQPCPEGPLDPPAEALIFRRFRVFRVPTGVAVIPPSSHVAFARGLGQSVAALALLFLPPAGPAFAQGPGAAVLPRGALLFRFAPSLTTVDGVYSAAEGTVALGNPFFLSELGASEIPALAPVEARLQQLAGTPTLPVRLGSTTGRLSFEEDRLPLELRYGLLDRVTLGVVVPFVRRRVDSALRYLPDGANVGASPAGSAPAEVAGFMASAGTALSDVMAAVEALCTAAGEADPQCVSGRTLLSEGEAFLMGLDESYAGEFFPLEGTAFGDAVQARWNALASELAGWDAMPPGSVPLAAELVSDETFRQALIAPAWGGDGNPLATPLPLWDLGDVELQAAVRVLETASDGGGAVGLQADIVASLRFPTGSADSLTAVVPATGARGVGGFAVGAEGLLHFSNLGVFASLEAGWHGETETTLLLPDPSNPFSPGGIRAPARWSPGGHLQALVLPHFRLGSVLSVGGGWHIFRQGADTYAPVGGVAGPLPSPEGSRTVHSMLLELRYTALDPSVADDVRLPFEAFVRMSRAMAGSGDRAPVEHRVQAGISLLLRR